MIVKHKQASTNVSQVLPIKMLFLSYLTNNEIKQFVEDCHSAIDQRISKLSTSIEANYSEISQIVDDECEKNKKLPSSNSLMQVIEEEQYGTTERDEDKLFQNERSAQNRAIQKLKRKFNESIKMLEKSNSKYEHIIYLYKKQLTDIAKELTKEKQINQKLSKELSQKQKDTSIRAFSVTNKSGSLGKYLPTATANKTSYSQNVTKQKATKKPFQQDSQDQQIRPPPKPFCEECLIRQKENQKRQKQSIEEKNKWKTLSLQITNLKDQLSRYEEQLISKQSQINKLTQELKKFKEDEGKIQNQEKKKLRTMNTTLRGEKIVLENQLLTLKKKIQEYEDLFSVTQAENKKLKIENQNFSSTIKWQQNTIQDLRKNYSTGVKEQGQIMKKYRQLQQQNQILCRQIQDQQKYLEQFVKKLGQVEKIHRQNLKKLEDKNVELQNIIEQKNQTIVKLKIENKRDQNNLNVANNLLNDSKGELINTTKTANRQCGVLKTRQDSSYGMIMNKTMKKETPNQGFQQNMIKLLNKKIVDKDETIEKLIKENQDLKQLLELSKDK